VSIGGEGATRLIRSEGGDGIHSRPTPRLGLRMEEKEAELGNVDAGRVTSCEPGDGNRRKAVQQRLDH